MKNKQNRRKGTLAILSAALLFTTSIAFLTDRVQNRKDADFGSVMVSTELTGDFLMNLAPGDKPELNLNVRNDGSLPGYIRTTLVAAVDEEEEALYEVGWLKGFVNDVEAFDSVNVYGIHDENTRLEPGVSTDYKIRLELSDAAINRLQNKGFRLDVLTEIKQRDGGEWEPLRTDTVGLGNEVDYDVVPPSNMIRTSNYYVRRGSLPELQTKGFVANYAGPKAITVGEYVTHFDNPVEELEVYSVVGDVALDSDIVKPGMSIALNKNGKVYDHLSIILKGDTNGDGRVAINDMMNVQSHLLDMLREGTSNVLNTEAKLLSADIDEDGIISFHDFQLLANDMLGAFDSTEAYPQKPLMNFKPRLDLNVYTGVNPITGENAPVKVDSNNKVKSGDIIKVDLGIESIAALNLTGLYTAFDFDNYKLTPITVGDVSGTSNSVLHSELGSQIADWDSMTQSLTDSRILLRMYENIGNKNLLKETGTVVSIYFKVSEDLVVGDVIDLSLVTGQSGFTFELRNGGSSFYDSFTRSLSTKLVVGQ